MRYHTTIPLLLTLGFVSPSMALADVQGYWLSEEETAQIELAPCESGSDVICGEIVWLEDPLDDDGEPLRDANNDDPELRDREIVGLEMVWGMEPDSGREGRWSGGRIYDPESGNTYRARMDLADDGETLDLRGYVGLPAFGRTSTWTRESARRSLD
ncbi:DUF2147 domain-containing protein [Aquisalimonas sp. 2447]|uniref:DUF2147 domain-containing protein n=1 Tax=Aquisalimonas sp. 2447 TaxID=2740807 RepID=UPI00143242E2|nr:DUF2147 domain-containing protein [Aquisalimonas sp. 2447]QIT54016.1 DUF2147 domain-containing protein [Aquisalimonas sp. 2447]